VINIREILTKEHSKRLTNLIVETVGNNPKQFDELLLILFGKDKLIAQRASWPLGYIIEKYPELVEAHWNILLDKLSLSPHVAYTRAVYRGLSTVKSLPNEIHGKVVDLCMNTIISINQPTAARVYAMYAMLNMVHIYPDLKDELWLRVEPLLQHDLPSIKAGAKKVLKQLRKINP
jgi:hypothetical protein